MTCEVGADPMQTIFFTPYQWLNPKVWGETRHQFARDSTPFPQTLARAMTGLAQSSPIAPIDSPLPEGSKNAR